MSVFVAATTRIFKQKIFEGIKEVWKCPVCNNKAEFWLIEKCLFHVYVVVNFSSQVIFVFLLFLGVVMYTNEVETKEKEKLPKIKN